MTPGALLKRLFGKEEFDARDLDPAQMWGRVYDLSKKQLVELDGFRLFVMQDDYVGLGIKLTSSYEQHVTQILKRVLREGDVFLDLGANIGYFSMMAASLVGSQGKVISFEPNPQNLQLIYNSVLQNGFKNISIYPFAASNAPDILRFANIGSNGLVVGNAAQDQRYSFLVPAVTVDTTLAHENRIDVVKMDIEAHEPLAFQGMRRLIARCKPVLLTEYHPWAIRYYNGTEPTDYLRDIIDAGYTLAVIDPDGELLDMADPEAVMAYWDTLAQEKIHLDLIARPV